ncbi:exported hypothetical protein [Candidatus Terasakiella magnetica]|uniref:Cytochrome c domain-containing protein n=1 Tax=Candidatus Terasakiella magnetica TaxID=1867952 RepID=A0A1C3RHT2_9PROT|nr:cytochrome c [Candidatus Terasakiella magnetica]SCA56762.1 exported hypothetical protein [Candidatus Terasakiella magnetica]
MVKLSRFALICGLMMCASSPSEAHGHIEEGEELFEQHCATCHGVDGDGNGEAGQDLMPPPANLLDAMQKRIVSDEYLMWTIREGGRNVHTDMPSFEERDTIGEAEAKKIIRYMWHAFK